MAVRSCHVTIQDTEGVSQTVEVTAASLYEAVAQGLASFRGNEWIADIGERLGVLKPSRQVEMRSSHPRKNEYSGFVNEMPLRKEAFRLYRSAISKRLVDLAH